MAYFSNGTEGEVLTEQCYDCPLGAGWHDPDQPQLFDNEYELRPCPVALVQLTHNYNQVRPSSCDAAAEILEHHQTDIDEKLSPLPTQLAKQPNGQQTFKPAIDWLRSADFRDAMSLLINEQGQCKVREQLCEIRKGNDGTGLQRDTDG